MLHFAVLFSIMGMQQLQMTGYSRFNAFVILCPSLIVPWIYAPEKHSFMVYLD